MQKNTVPLDCFRFVLRKTRLKRCGFPHFFIVFYSFAVSDLSMYAYTPSGRKTANSALNPFASGSILIKNSPKIQFSPYFPRLCFDFPEFLMRQPRLIQQLEDFTCYLVGSFFCSIDEGVKESPVFPHKSYIIPRSLTARLVLTRGVRG